MPPPDRIGPPTVKRAPACTAIVKGEKTVLPTPVWRGTFVRDPGAPTADSFDCLIVGAQHAVTAVFDPWLRAVKEGKKAPLETMLATMHRVLADGSYGGHMGQSGNPWQLSPGRMLREDPRWRGQRFRLNADPAALPEMRGLSLQHLPMGVSEKKMPAFVPRWAWPRIHRLQARNEAGEIREWFKYEYVAPECHRHCIVEMGKELRKAVSLLDGGDTEAFVDALARYHYIGISTQLFPRVNNSLLMTQINHLLVKHGLLGIPHGRLDYEALVLSPDDYVAQFKKSVAEYNPGALG